MNSIGKILTIAVCAYNMQDYLEQALNSCLIKNKEKLEVLIMNDGSTDRTKEIAQLFVDKFPDTFILINKSNGGWGSNLNMAVELASGKYFMELDADDWYETRNLQELVNNLESCESELIVAKHRRQYDNYTMNINPEWKKYSLKTGNFGDCHVFYFPIWSAAYLTETLKKYYIKLPEHCQYTDNLFILYFLPYVDKVKFFDKIIYNYRIGREGQSISVASLKKHYHELLLVLNCAFNFCKECTIKKNKNHVYGQLKSIYLLFINFLFLIEKNKELQIKKHIIKLETILKLNFPEIYKETNKSKKLKLLRLTHYLTLPIINLWANYKNINRKRRRYN